MSNMKLLLILLLVLSVVGSFSFYTRWIYQRGIESERGACNLAKGRVIDENIEIKKKQDAVMRPSERVLIDRLRDGSF